MVDIYKVHWLYETNPEIVTYLKDRGKKVFLDYKIHDIPSTMGHRIASLSKHADYITYHCLSGKEGILSVLKHAGDTVAIESLY